MSTVVETANVPTQSADRYLQQLCKHWSHNLQVELGQGHGSVVFPKDLRGANYPGEAVVTFHATPESLDVRIEASAPEQLDGLKGAVAKHLDRFAFRKAPLEFRWNKADAPQRLRPAPLKAPHY